MRLGIVAVLLSAIALTFPAWTQDADEVRLIETLKSNGSVADKDAACKRLKDIGTAKSVPALAACLGDDALSHPARIALEAMACSEAGDALLAALSQTSGLNRVGVIDSLGMRREEKAVGALAGLLGDADAATVAAAARSLGRIGTRKAAGALQKALPKTSGAAHAAIVDGLLHAVGQSCNDRFMRKIAEGLYKDPSASEGARLAAYRAWVHTAKRGRLRLVTRGLTGDDPIARKAALGLAGEICGEGATEALIEVLDQVSPSTQVALLAALGQRGETAACEGVLKLTKSAEAEVRLAALKALVNVGDTRAVPVLAEMAASSSGDEQRTARQTLSMIPGGDVDQALLDLLPKAQPKTQIELIKALAARRDDGAVHILLGLTQQGDEGVQIAALRAIGALGDETSVDPLMKLFVETKSDPVRGAAADAVVAVAGNVEKNEGIAAKFLAVGPTSAVPVRVEAIRSAARIRPDLALPALRDAVKGQNPEVRNGAVRTLAELGGVEAVDDLLGLAREATDDTERTIALRGYWRLAGLTADRPAKDRLEQIRAGLAQAQSADDKRGGLAALAGMGTKEALEYAEEMCRDEAVRTEAESASYQIASRLFIVERPVAERVLRRLAAEAKDEGTRTNAGNFKATLDAKADYVVPWLVSQPYRVEGKKADELFDTALGPELPDGGGVKWSAMPAPTDANQFWMVDLSSVVGGDHCVVYLKTQVFWPKEGEVELDMGSDDGIKVWINGAQVYANNAIRGFTADQDKATAKLKKGWNTFQVKISQHTAGCSMAMRLHGPDVKAGEPLKVEAK